MALPPCTRIDPKKMQKILVIDDETNLREAIAEILELSSYQAITASNGSEGLALAIAEKPDLIICDVQMPEMDGFQMLRALRQHTNAVPPPFIFLSACADRDDLRAGMQEGAQDYITKPFSSKEVLDAVALRLSLHQSMKENIASGLRQQVSETMHDDVQPMMLAAKFGLQTVSRQVAAGERANSAIQSAMGYLNQALMASRSVAQNLVAQSPKHHLANFLQELQQRIGSVTEIKLSVQEELGSEQLSKCVQEQLCYIIEELTTNALKHSQASHISIQLLPSGSSHGLLCFRDNGVGFETLEVTHGLGLRNIEKRTQQLQGNLDMHSFPNNGTSVCIKFSTSPYATNPLFRA